ncbi:SUMF1/EgtB/PvdO family nonheme iron enzyme [Pontiellaceae bacterium B12219]|nr:SUMF1/EgtB/PvdO family nonheme iron enzyme [Pontiellaceae bacterium B12219]
MTPKKWRKKENTRAGKRRVTFGIAKHWRNPFQIAIIAVALVSFISSQIVDRLKQQQVFEETMAQAKLLRTEMDALDAQAMTIYSNLQAAFGDSVEKEVSEEEQELIDELAGVSSELDTCFAQINACYTTMAYRYRSVDWVQNWFVDTARWSFESALSRNDFEQARRWFNSSHVNALLLDMKSRIKGGGSLEISAGDDVYEIIVWALKLDGSRLVLANHAGRSSTFPYTIPEIETGPYLIMITSTAGGYFPYPVYIEPGEEKQVTLEIPKFVSDDLVFVPGGPFICGGGQSPFYREHVRTLPSFYIKTYEVTVAEYLEFWKSLSDPQQRSAMMSCINFSDFDEEIEAWDADGRVLDERVKPDFPVVGISCEAAAAYCEWKGRQLGVSLRLPTAFEWEKAARGVDGRIYPWGYDFDASENLALTLDNVKGKEAYPFWAPRGKFNRDISVYNVRNMGGNVREYVTTSNGDCQIRGGSSATPASFMDSTFVSSDTDALPSDVGFRYVMEVSAHKPVQ